MSGLFVEQNLNRAKSLIRNGEVLEAFNIYKKIIKKFPNNERAKLAIKKLQPPQVKINTLLEYYQTGQYEEAEVLSKKLTKNFPSHPIGWQVLGAVFMQTKRVKDSIFPFEQNLLINSEGDPNPSTLMRNISIIHWVLNSEYFISSRVISLTVDLGR